MTNSITAVKSTLILLLFLLCLPLQAQSGRVDWEEAGQVTLAEMPIDIARSQDAEYTFVLTAKGKVYIYGKDGSLAGEIPVEPSVSKIAVSPKGDQLYLLSEKNKSLKTINLSFIEEINIAGSPFLGAADARVSVVVFSDFQ
jgi:hypothetical protein